MVKDSVQPRLMNSLTENHTAIIRPVKTFVLKSSMEFASRSSDVFNELNTLERDHESWVTKNKTHNAFEVNKDAAVSESDFKKPFVSGFKKPFVSDFKKPFAPISRKRKETFISRRRNMKKWIKYSLKDVPLSSDAKNTAVALKFLDELRKRKEKKCDEEINSSDNLNHSFRKPAKKNKDSFNSFTSSVSASSECASNRTEKAHIRAEKDTSSNIKLDHLQNFDEF